MIITSINRLVLCQTPGREALLSWQISRRFRSKNRREEKMKIGINKILRVKGDFKKKSLKVKLISIERNRLDTVLVVGISMMRQGRKESVLRMSRLVKRTKKLKKIHSGLEVPRWVWPGNNSMSVNSKEWIGNIMTTMLKSQDRRTSSQNIEWILNLQTSYAKVSVNTKRKGEMALFSKNNLLRHPDHDKSYMNLPRKKMFIQVSRWNTNPPLLWETMIFLLKRRNNLEIKLFYQKALRRSISKMICLKLRLKMQGIKICQVFLKLMHQREVTKIYQNNPRPPKQSQKRQ